MKGIWEYLKHFIDLNLLEKEIYVKKNRDLEWQNFNPFYNTGCTRCLHGAVP